MASLNAGKATFHEPGFDDLLARTVDQGSLRFTTDPTELADHDVVFLCVGTPQVSGGSAADLSQVWSAVADLAPHLAADAVLVGKSTVPVGTAARIADFLVERGSSATVVWNPEFLREGFAVRDTLEPDRIVVGAPETLRVRGRSTCSGGLRGTARRRDAATGDGCRDRRVGQSCGQRVPGDQDLFHQRHGRDL